MRVQLKDTDIDFALADLHRGEITLTPEEGKMTLAQRLQMSPAEAETLRKTPKFHSRVEACIRFYNLVDTEALRKSLGAVFATDIEPEEPVKTEKPEPRRQVKRSNDEILYENRVVYKPLQVSTNFPEAQIEVITFDNTLLFSTVKHKEGYQLLKSGNCVTNWNHLMHNYRDEMARLGFSRNLQDEFIYAPNRKSWDPLPASCIRYSRVEPRELVIDYSPAAEPFNWTLVESAEEYMPHQKTHLGCYSVITDKAQFSDEDRNRRWSRSDELKLQRESMSELMEGRRAEMRNLGFNETRIGERYVWHSTKYKRLISKLPEDLAILCNYQIEAEWNHFTSECQRSADNSHREEYDNLHRTYMLEKLRNCRPPLHCASGCKCEACNFFSERIMERHKEEFDKLQFRIDSELESYQTLFQLHETRFNRNVRLINSSFDTDMKTCFGEFYEMRKNQGHVPTLKTYDTSEFVR